MSAIQWSETFFRLCQNRATRKRSISPSANEGRCALRIAAQPYSITKRKPPAAAGETGGRVEHMQKTIHAAFLPHNPFLPTLRRYPLFLLRTELWGQRTNSTHDSSSSCSSIGVKRLHIE